MIIFRFFVSIFAISLTCFGQGKYFLSLFIKYLILFKYNTISNQEINCLISFVIRDSDHLGYYKVRYDLACTAFGSNLDFDTAKSNCVNNPECVGVARQNLRRQNPSCGDRIIRMCKLFALRGECDCNIAGCNPSACDGYEKAKTTCFYQRGKIFSSL